MNATLTITIGRNTSSTKTPLPKEDWEQFQQALESALNDAAEGVVVFGRFLGKGEYEHHDGIVVKEESFLISAGIETLRKETLEEDLKELAEEFDQEAIAVAVAPMNKEIEGFSELVER